MPNWTDAQLDAIKARRGTVLVSAAAGSGKTAVLVERVIERLTDLEHPTDADRLLVVTFTKAAAAEMRDRIEKRLLALMKEQPENTRLRRQQLLLQQAHICTVDSFCSDIVREFFYLLGISPDFSIITDKQQEELMTESLDEILTEWYKDENFRADLADVLGGDKNDARLSAAILKMYEYTRSHPFPDKWMRDIQKAMTDVTQSPVKTPWGEVVRQHIMEVYDFAIKLSHSAYRLAAEDPDLEKAYCTALGADIDKLSAKLQAMEDPETCRFSDLTITFDKLGSFRGEDPRADRIKAMRDMVKKEIGKLQKLAGDAEDQKFTEEIAATTGTVVYLFLAVQSFEKTYSAKKREKNVLDFSDLEHMALQLFLTEQEDGTFRRTETAKLVSERFDEIMTDEYQDSISYNWPISLKRLEAMGEEAMQKPYYEDENGNKIEYDNTAYINGVEIIIDPMTREEVDVVINFIKSLDQVMNYDQQLLNIINEESAAYFEGQKSVNEVADIIQSRVQIYINENR